MSRELEGATHGLELELADVDRRCALPAGCSWNRKEVTLVNSDGTAVWSHDDARPFGGEINTAPTPDVDSQVRWAEEVFALPSAAINYRCNLQVHVGLPNLAENLEALQALVSYAQEHHAALELATLAGAVERPAGMPAETWSHYRQRRIPDWRFSLMMAAQDVAAFRLAYRCSRAGVFTRGSSLGNARYMINVYARHVRSALEFARRFVAEALGKRTDPRLWLDLFEFPPAQPFDAALERGYARTAPDFKEVRRQLDAERRIRR